MGKASKPANDELCPSCQAGSLQTHTASGQQDPTVRIAIGNIVIADASGISLIFRQVSSRRVRGMWVNSGGRGRQAILTKNKQAFKDQYISGQQCL